MEKAKGAQGTGSNQYQVRSHDTTAPQTLSDMGISKKQFSRYQKLADVPEDQFESDLHEAKAKGKLLTSRGPVCPRRARG